MEGYQLPGRAGTISQAMQPGLEREAVSGLLGCSYSTVMERELLQNRIGGLWFFLQKCIVHCLESCLLRPQDWEPHTTSQRVSLFWTSLLKHHEWQVQTILSSWFQLKLVCPCVCILDVAGDARSASWLVQCLGLVLITGVALTWAVVVATTPGGSVGAVCFQGSKLGPGTCEILTPGLYHSPLVIWPISCHNSELNAWRWPDLILPGVNVCATL